MEKRFIRGPNIEKSFGEVVRGPSAAFPASLLHLRQMVEILLGNLEKLLRRPLDQLNLMKSSNFDLFARHSSFLVL